MSDIFNAVIIKKSQTHHPDTVFYYDNTITCNMSFERSGRARTTIGASHYRHAVVVLKPIAMWHNRPHVCIEISLSPSRRRHYCYRCALRLQFSTSTVHRTSRFRIYAYWDDGDRTTVAGESRFSADRKSRSNVFLLRL